MTVPDRVMPNYGLSDDDIDERIRQSLSVDLMTVCGARWVANIHERIHVGWGVVEEYTHRCILACEMPK